MSNLISPKILKPGDLVRLVKNKRFFYAQREKETISILENEILFIVSKETNAKLNQTGVEVLFLAPCGLIYDIYPQFFDLLFCLVC